MKKDKNFATKEAYLAYIESVPIHKWACKAVKISQKTSERWRKDDQDFDDQCEARIATWVGKTLKQAKAEFKLERIMKDDFAERKELTGAEGQSLQIEIIEATDRKKT